MENMNLPQRRPRKKSKEGTWLSITTNSSIWMLVTKCVLMFLVPYGYLFLCGYIDSRLIRSGFAHREAFILFVFFSLMTMWIIGAVLAVISIVKWCKRKKK